MNKTLSVGAILLFGVSISLTATSEPVNAQGPAGVGATAAAQDSSHSPHSLNPVKWIKKDSKDSAAAPASRTDAEKKLTPALQAQGMLGRQRHRYRSVCAILSRWMDALPPFTRATISV